jgi:hypothetical protein
MRKEIQLFNIGDTPAKVRITHARRSLLYFAKTFFKGIEISSSQEIVIRKLDKMQEKKEGQSYE